MRHFDRRYNGDIAYITSNDAQRIYLYGHNEHGQDQSAGFNFHLDDKVTSEWKGFKMRAVPDHNYSFSGHYINDTISLDIIIFRSDDHISTGVHYYLSYS